MSERLIDAELMLQRVLAQRQRQMQEKGYTAEHDDKHTDGSMADCAGMIAVMCSDADDSWESQRASHVLQKYERAKQLEIAGALIIAEMERLYRQLPKHVYQVQDGETHLYVARSAEEAKLMHESLEYGEPIEEVSQLADDRSLTIRGEDGEDITKTCAEWAAEGCGQIGSSEV